MLEFLKRLMGRSAKTAAEEPPDESPSWRPGQAPQSPAQRNPQVFSTLQPGSTPALKPPKLGEDEAKDKPVE